MNTLFGIALDAWVTINRDCDMSAEVVVDQAQITLGHPTGTLQLVLDEAGLTKLADVVSRTLSQMKASA